jgi:hypothetical protein
MTDRIAIGASFQNADLIRVMAEGDPKAETIVKGILEDPFLGGHMAILCLDSMNIRGEQLCLAYEFSENSLPALLCNIQEPDSRMFEYINANTSGDEKAFPSGPILNRRDLP